MYLSRSIDALLLEWKNSSSLKPLLLRGARQVGKSWAVEHLGKSFDHFIEVNFEKRPDMIEVFERVHDVHDLANNLSILYNTPIEAGKTLLFLSIPSRSTNFCRQRANRLGLRLNKRRVVKSHCLHHYTTTWFSTIVPS